MKIVLALHGFLGLTSDWHEVRKAFHAQQDEYQFVPVDYMNIRGLTPDVNLERWGENFCLWAEKNFPKKDKTIVGYSLGGRLALHAVVAKPSTWKQACFLSTHPGLKTDLEKFSKRDVDQRWAQRFQTADFDSVVRDWMQQVPFTRPQLRIKRDAHDHNTQLLARVLVQWSLGRQKDLAQHEALAQLPTSWLAGEFDEKYTKLIQALAQSELNCLSTHVIPGSTHHLLMDQPETVASLLSHLLGAHRIKQVQAS